MKNTKIKKSLRSKLIKTMLLTLALVGIVTLGVVAWIQYETSKTNMSALEHYIRESIVSKGEVLIENHSLALKGLALDNAYGDVIKLVTRTVKEDTDVVYGLYLDSDSSPWVYASPSNMDNKNKEAWKELNLKPENLKLKELTTRELSIFKNKVYEVSMPVFDGDELLGTIRYGLSLARVHIALEKTRQESKAALKNTLYVLGGVVLVITFLGILLSSRAASKITKPLRNLTTAANTIASGDRKVKVNIKSGDEIEVLGNSFNQMVSDLNASYESLADLNKNLENKVEERTAELSSRNRDMRMIMENVDQGFITVLKDGVMSPERSSIVDTWFNHCKDGMTFVEFLSHVDPGFAEWFEMSWEELYEDIMPLEVIVDQMPKHMLVADRHLQFEYSPIMDENDSVMGLLVVIADITEQLEHEKKEAAQKEIMSVFKRISKDKRGYLAFEKDAESLIHTICNPDENEDLALLKRIIHTLKGNAGLFGVVSIAEICHQVETEMEESKAAPSDEARKSIQARWNDFLERTRIFTKQDDTTMEISIKDYEKIVAAIEKRQPNFKVLEQLRSWQLEPIDKQFDRISEQALAMAERLGKGQIVVEKDSNGLKVDAKVWSEFWSVVSHVVRNAIDHGLEDEGVRKEHHKDAGRLILSSTIKNGDLEISVGDNGSGINWKKVAEKADQNGLPHDNEADLLNVLLSDGFSTRSEVTSTSGRGVGLAAVKQAVEKLSGRIEVDSKEGKGTSWRFIFPSSAGSIYQDHTQA